MSNNSNNESISHNNNIITEGIPTSPPIGSNYDNTTFNYRQNVREIATAPPYPEAIPISNQLNELHRNTANSFSQDYTYTPVNVTVQHPFGYTSNENWGICKGCNFQFIRCEKDKHSQSYFYCNQCVELNFKKRCCASCIIS